MAKKRIFRQQLNMWNKEPQALHLGDINILSASVSENSTWLDVWFEDNYDRQDHLPPKRNFRVLMENQLVPPHYTYVTTAVTTFGKAYHIYREDSDLMGEYLVAVQKTKELFAKQQKDLEL